MFFTVKGFSRRWCCIKPVVKHIFWILCVVGISQSAMAAGSVSLNQFQVIGSHNSYKLPVPAQVKAGFQQINPRKAQALNYSHLSLTEQLNIGLRHLELDVLYDPQGGKFSFPVLAKSNATYHLNPDEQRQLAKPGFKTLHIPDIDYKSHCYLFVRCLQEIKHWSEQHPTHHPIVILINAKESPAPIEYATPVKAFDKLAYERLDQAIFTALSHQKLITPDDITKHHASLNKAVQTDGWPEISASLGKFLFLFDGNQKQNQLYRNGHPNLRGRAMFASYPVSEDEAAFFIINNPIQRLSDIQHLVKQGYMVRTRADANVAGTTDLLTTQQQAAFTSGAQVISTDFYPNSPQTTRSGYQVSFTHHQFIRRNPLETVIKGHRAASPN